MNGIAKPPRTSADDEVPAQPSVDTELPVTFTPVSVVSNLDVPLYLRLTDESRLNVAENLSSVKFLI